MQTQHRDGLDLAIAYLDSLTNGGGKEARDENTGKAAVMVEGLGLGGRNLEEDLMVKMSQHA